MVTTATQSMSRVARCIDNGPMEGFWGLMKREMYYGKKYKTKEFNEILTGSTPFHWLYNRFFAFQLSKMGLYHMYADISTFFPFFDYFCCQDML